MVVDEEYLLISGQTLTSHELHLKLDQKILCAVDPESQMPNRCYSNLVACIDEDLLLCAMDDNVRR